MQKLIHVGCRALGLDSDARHDLQLLACGKASMRDMSERDLHKVMAVLEQKGFTPAPSPHKYPLAPRPDLRLVHVLWRELAQAGALTHPGRGGLNAFIRARFGPAWGAVPADVDMLRDWKQIDMIIQAFLQWCDRVGCDLDHERLGRKGDSR